MFEQLSEIHICKIHQEKIDIMIQQKYTIKNLNVMR